MAPKGQRNTTYSQVSSSEGEAAAVQLDTEGSTPAAPQRSWSRGKHANLFAEFKKSDEADKRISHINDNPELYTWKANPCLLQKSHPDYAACSEGEPAREDPELPDRVTKQTLAQALNDLSGDATEKDKKNEAEQAEKPKAKKAAFVKNARSGSRKFGEKTEEFHAAAKRA